MNPRGMAASIESASMLQLAPVAPPLMFARSLIRGDHVPFAALLALALAAVACGGTQLEVSRPCLVGDDPRTKSARAMWERAQRGPPLERACALEAVPRHFYDYSDRSDAPACRSSFVDRMERAVFSSQPVPYSRLQLARIHAVGAVGDSTDVMPRKASLLLRLAELPDAEISAYERVAGEAGPPLPKAFLRQLALYELTRSNLFLNDASARDYLTARLNDPRSDLESLVLAQNTAGRLFVDSLWGHPGRADDPSALAVLDRWITQAGARLDERRFDPVRFETLLLHVQAIGFYGQRFGHEKRARAVLRRIVAAEAAVPFVSGHEGARRDLLVFATLALFDLNNRQRTVSPRAAGPVDLWREQEPFISGVDWIDVELYGNRGLVCPSAVTTAASRDAALEQFLNGHVPRSRDAPGWNLPPTVISLGSSDEEPTRTRPREPTALGFARVLGRNPTWLSDPDVRQWVMSTARTRPAVETGRRPLERVFVPLTNRILRTIDADATDEAHMAREILVEFVADIEALLLTDTRTIKNLDQAEAQSLAIYLLGEHGARFGMGEEVEALLVRLEALPDPEDWPNRFRRAATGARAYAKSRSPPSSR